jgi:nucleoside-diphosphate-sugar epimerase
VHAEDIARAFLAVLEAPSELVHDQAFNVGRDEDVVQVRDIALAVSEHFDAPVTFAEGASADKRDYKVDFTKISTLLPQFQPRWTVPLGIQQLAEDMHRNGLAADDFVGPRYVRLRRIEQLQQSGAMDTMLRLPTAAYRSA